MFEHARTGYCPLLGHMADDKECDPHLLGQSQEHCRGLVDLGDTAGRRCDLIAVHGLNGIDHHGLRLVPADDIGDDLQICLAQKLQGIRRAADPRSSELDLPQGFLSRNIQDLNPASRHKAGSLQQDRRFSDSRVSADQDERSGHGAAAEDAVQLPETCRKPGLLRFLNSRERDRFYAVIVSAQSKTGCGRRNTPLRAG